MAGLPLAERAAHLHAHRDELLAEEPETKAVVAKALMSRWHQIFPLGDPPDYEPDLGLADGGALCGLICDASMPTYLLTHWARDRTRGEGVALERSVHLQTARPAAVYGFTDRGTLEPGKRADVNVIDLQALTLHAPEMRFDLPASGRRLVQRVDGYLATVVAGETTFGHGVPTGRRPGRLVRGGAATD